MAFIQMNVMSQSLMRTVNVNVILPTDKLTFPGFPVRENKPYKTLYLLHGVFGSNTDWINGTRIQRYAEENDLVVVMPAGENSFYLDQPAVHNLYGEFVGKELVEMTRKMFPLSEKREDTFIGGLSMGGYGALVNGLRYHQTFGCILSLSGAVNLDGISKKDRESPIFFEGKTFSENIFGPLDRLLGSDKDPKHLIRKLKEQNQEIPKIFMACGEQDSLLEANLNLAEFLRKEDIGAVFETAPGNHEWDFWDRYIKKSIYEWLPTEHNGLGINSGNVGI